MTKMNVVLSFLWTIVLIIFKGFWVFRYQLTKTLTIAISTDIDANMSTMILKFSNYVLLELGKM